MGRSPWKTRLRYCAQIVLVVDASVLVAALADDGLSGDIAGARLRGETLAVPEVADLEVASVLRRQNRAGLLSDRRAQLALPDLAVLPLRRASHAALSGRTWELRGNLTVYDAAYVALAEALECPLIIGDQRAARSPGPTCRIELLSTP